MDHMFDDDNNYDVFQPDTRNRRGGRNAKKRNNYVEIVKRQKNVEKRKGVEMSPEYLIDNEYEKPEKIKKYTNGKAQRELKVQDYYIEDEEESTKQRNKKKKNRKK